MAAVACRLPPRLGRREHQRHPRGGGLAAVLGLSPGAGQPPAGAGAHGEQAQRGAAEGRGVGHDDRTGAGRDAVRVASQRGRRVDQQGDAVLATEGVDVGHRLAGADLGVRGLERRGGDVTAGERHVVRGGVDPAQQVDGHRLRHAGLEQHHRALRGPGDDPRAGAAAGVPQPGEPELERRLGARVHRQLVGSHAHRPGQHLAGGVEHRAGPTTRRVEPGGVGPRRVEGGREGLRGQGCRGPRAASSSPVTCRSRGERATLRR